MDIHSTTSNNLTKHSKRSSAMKVLFAAMFLVAAAFESLAEETFPPTSMAVSEAQACVGDDLTVTIVAPDTAGAYTLQSVPWQVSYNGSILSATELSDYITLDVATGSSLEDWSMSTTLAFEVLQAGCYDVSLENGALQVATNDPNFPLLAQIVTPTEFVVSGVPSAPVASDYTSVLCAGDMFSASMSTNSAGPAATTLSYTLIDPSGATLANDNVTASGLGCNGPSLSLALPPLSLDTLGTYALAINANNTCGTSLPSVESVEVVGAPSFSLSTTPVCQGEDALVVSDIQATDYTNSVAGTPAVQWTWSNGNSSLGITNLVNPADGDVVDQTVDLIYTVIDDNGTSTATCSGTASTVQVVHTPTPLELSFNGEASVSTLCAGEMLDVAVVSGSASNETATYSWFTSVPPNDGNATSRMWQALNQSVDITVGQNSVFDDGTTCDNSDSPVAVTIPVNAIPSISWANGDDLDAACAGSVAALNVNLVASSGAATTVSWSSELGEDEQELDDSGAVSVQLDLPAEQPAGAISISVNAVDNAGCVSNGLEGFVDVRVAQSPSGEFEAACEGQEIQPTNVPEGGNLSYSWTYNGLPFSGEGNSTSTPTFPAVNCLETPDIELALTTAYDVAGETLVCTSELLAFPVTVTPVAQFALSLPDVLCADSDVELEVSGPGLTAFLCEDATLNYAWAVDRGNGFEPAGEGTSLDLNTGDAGPIVVSVEAITTGSAGTCVNTQTAELSIASNPVLSPFAEDLMFCEDGSLNLDAEFDLNENGGIAYTWELGDLTAFILQGQGTPGVSLSLSPESTASDGTLGLAVVDAAGCQTSTLVAFDVLTLPVPGTVSWEAAPALACSGEGVTFNMEAPLLDPALDPQAFTYEWTATNAAGDVLPTVPTTDPLTDLLTGVALPTAAWTPTLQPDQVTMELTLSDGLCTSSTQYPNAIQIYPRPRVTSGDADLNICAGDDWTGVLTGASSLAFTGPFTFASYEEFSNEMGEVLWTMPWSEIGPLHAQNDPVNFPTSFGLTAVSDFGLLTCENNWTLDVVVQDNPEIAALPAEVVLCDNGDLDLAAEVLLNPNGGLDFAWDLNASDDFNTEVTNGGQTLTLSPIDGSDASGTTVTLVVTDGEGCIAQSATALSVHSAPAPVNVMFSELDSAICSGGSITLTMDDPVLDGSSTLDDVSYIWTAMGSNNEEYTVDQLSPFVDEAGDLTLATSQGWSSDFDPVTVSFELDMTDGVCASTFSFPDQISLYPSPRITVPNNLDYHMCEGFDWTGPILGASSLEYLSPYTGELIEMSSTTGTIDWVMPWSEAEAAMQAGDPTVFELLAISDFGGAVCTDTWTLTLDVVGNPMINPNNTNVPAEICVGQSGTISSGMVQGSGNGQPLSFVWSNAGDDPIFNVNPIQTGASAGISVNTDIPVPASGDVTFTLTDGAGCQADTTLSVVIHELPTFGALNATPDAVCSGEEIQLTFDGIDVDDNLDVADATYTWSASVDGSNVAVNGDDFSLNVTPAIGAVVAAEFTDPTPVVFELTAGSDGCVATQTWDDVVFVYPAPRIQNSNPYVCQDQEWSAVITGPENLMTLGQNGLDSLVWEINGAGQFDVTLPPDYLVLQGGQSVQTFAFQGTIEYEDVGLTCVSNNTLNLNRRLAPAFAVTGDDTSGPAGDLVMCEGADLTLNSFVDQNGATESFSWQVDDGYPHQINEDDAYFIDVLPQSPLTSATVVTGVATVVYSDYNSTPAEFECVVEQPWSFTVLPTPSVDWTIPEWACDGASIQVEVGLATGADSLAGDGLTWDWDWNTSTFNETVPSDAPTTSISFPAAYEPSIDGIHDQNVSLVVTDSYGCVSLPSTQTVYALEFPVLSLETALACEGDTVTWVASGADDYTWFGINGFEDPTETFNPGYASTGTDISELIVAGIDNPVTVEVSGSIPYIIPGSGTFASCFTSALTNTNLSATASEFELPVLSPEFTVAPVFCEGGTVDFMDLNEGDNLPGTSYSFFATTGLELDNVPSSETSFEVIADSTVFEVTKSLLYVQGEDSLVCSAQFDSTFVVFAPPTVALTGPSGICQGEEATLTWEVTNFEASSEYTPIWFHGNTYSPTEIDNQATLVPDVGIGPAPSALMEVGLRVEDDRGCVSDLETWTVDVLATPVLAWTLGLPEEVCSPAQGCAEVGLLNEGLPFNTGVEYIFGNAAPSPINSACDNYTNPSPCPRLDSMAVVVRFAHDLDADGTLFCTNRLVDSIMVNPTPEPSFALDAPQACLDTADGNCIPLAHDLGMYDFCEDDSLSFNWYVTPLGDLDITDFTIEDADQVMPSICLEKEGAVEIVIEVENLHGCSQTSPAQPFVVRGLPRPELTFLQESICLPTTVSVLNSSAGAANFSMSIPGFPTYEDFLSPLELNVEFPGYYDADFTVSNTYTVGEHVVVCAVDTTYEQAFEGRTPPVAMFEVLPDTVVEFVDPVVDFDNMSTGAVEYIWSFGNGEGSAEEHPSVEYARPGTYNTQLLVVNEFGCTDVHSQSIDVTTDLYVYAPNAFTPNNDGLNDAWAPSIIGQDLIASYECHIMNRSNHVLFYSEDPNEAWDGSNAVTGEGLHYSSGGEVFAWRIAIKKKGGRGAIIYTGHIQMIR